MNIDFIKQFTTDLDAIGVSRREALKKAGRIGVGTAIAVTPLVAMAKDVQAAKFGSAFRAHDSLQFALTLEYLEYFFYKRAVEEADIPSADLPIFQTIRDHEEEHYLFLRNVILGLTDPAGDPDDYEQDDFDYTVAGFDPFADGNYMELLALAQGFEDTGVRAYKGQAPALQGGPYLTAALQIHSVEARHASIIRRMRGKNGYITLNNTDVSQIQSTYAGEEFAQYDLGGANFSDELISQAFDEPLTMEAVLDIAGPFITGDPTDREGAHRSRVSALMPEPSRAPGLHSEAGRDVFSAVGGVSTR